MPAVGSKVPMVELKNGDNMLVTFAVMDVTAPLAAVSRMVKAGHTMVLLTECVQTSKSVKHPLTQRMVCAS